MLSRLVLSFGLLAGLAPVAANAAERPVVVELFTSQGCSSCPPANAYLNELSRGRRDVLALAFHVTYWDRLGWKDPFSIEAATDRQGIYGRRFGDGSYTPEIVVDGVASMVGSDRSAVGPAIEKAKRAGSTAAAVNVTKNGEQVSIEVGAGSGNGKNTADRFRSRAHHRYTPRRERRPYADRSQCGPFDPLGRSMVGWGAASQRALSGRPGRRCRAGGAGWPDHRRQPAWGGQLDLMNSRAG